VLPDGRSIVRSDKVETAIGIFENLHDSMDQIPPALIEFAEALRSVAPNLFDAALMHRVQLVDYGFSPVSATEFVEVLSRDVQREVEYPVSTNQAVV
jgi:hypothetical protein